MKQRNPWAWVPSLYFAEGLPYVAVMVLSTYLYKQIGMNNADITFYTSWLYLPWIIKPLWSPFIDLIKTKRWWIVAMQLLVGASLGGLAFTIPTHSWLQGSLFFFWVMAFSSATHDIAADGFYMIGLRPHQQALFVGIRSTFYRLSQIFGQGVLITVAGTLQVYFRGQIRYSWSLTFYGLAGLFIACWLYHSYILPKHVEDQTPRCANVKGILQGVWSMVKTFLTKYPVKETVAALLFMLFYRMPEGLLAKITPLFLIDPGHAGGLGLSPQEVGLVQGTVGVIGLTLGGILGGMAISKGGLRQWLWPMAIAITLPNIVFVYLSYSLPSSLIVINVCFFVEQFGYGFGFSAYMLYLIYYSRGAFKTSHYALCTAFMALSMMLPGLVAGKIQDVVGYRMFFILVMILCLVTFIVTAFIKVDGNFGKKTDDRDLALKESEEIG